jgi:molecular chaperone DnaJ
MATTKRDYYEVLGVGRSASEDEVRKAHRRLVLQYHPDRNTEPGASERFKEIQEAYEILSDRQKRATYDRFGHVGENGGLGGSPFGRAGGFGIEDIFDTFFGGGATSTGRRQRVQRGADLRVDLKISFDEAVFGTAREISFARHDTCSVCTGSGVEPGSTPISCVRCGGSGELRRVHQNLFGQFVNVSVCDRCNGHGSVIKDPCKECRGQGSVQIQRKLKVAIPAGIDDDSQIRLSSEGEPGPNGGPPGHLYLVIHVESHRFFRRQGNDLLLDLPINFAQAALGDEIDVPVLDPDEKTARLKIPAGTQSGRLVRLRARGVPHLNDSGRGDLQVRLRVVTPTEVTDEQRKLLRQLAATFDHDVTPQENKGFFDKVKDAFGV